LPGMADVVPAASRMKRYTVFAPSPGVRLQGAGLWKGIKLVHVGVLAMHLEGESWQVQALGMYLIL
jgi:hypothetical protein